MKPTLLPLLLLLALASCTITKRKYMPGYAVNWEHKTHATMVVSKPDVENKTTNLSYVKPVEISNQILSQPQQFRTRHVMPLPIVQPGGVGTSNMMSTPLQAQWKGLKRDFGGIVPVDSVKNEREKVVCKEANTSLILGIIAWLVFLILIYCALIAGANTLNNGGNLLGIVIIIFGIIVAGIIGAILGVIAIIFGISALHKINMNPEKYKGKWKAIAGISLVLLPIIIALIADLISKSQ